MTVPEVFSSVTEAKNSLDYYHYAYVCGIKPAKPFNGIGAHDDSWVTLHKWSCAFDAFIKVCGRSLSDGEQLAISMLHIRRLLYSCLIDTASKTDPLNCQMEWDKYISTFDEIVSIAESIFSESRPNASVTPFSLSTTSRPFPFSAWPPDKGEQKPIFSLEVGIINPMYEVGTKCRDPFIRRRALNILRTLSWREGVLDSLSTAQVVERMIAIEEAGSSGPVKSCIDIPCQARIPHICRRFKLDRGKMSLSYSHWLEGDSGVRLRLENATRLYADRGVTI